MFTTSPTTAKLDEALAKAQGEVMKALKDKMNPHFKSHYADLASIWDACRQALSFNKVNLTQWPLHSEDGRLHLMTRLACEGEWLMCHSSVPLAQNSPQGFGSALTYLRRYTLSAAVGIASDDDDGNAASPPPRAAPPPEPVRQRPEPEAIFKASDPAQLKAFVIYLEKEGIKDPFEQQKICDQLDGKPKRMTKEIIQKVKAENA